MWKSVYLNGEFSRAIFKTALQKNHVRLATPRNFSESQQLDDARKEINRSRADQEALMYCLLAEQVYVDPPCGNWDLYDCGDKPFFHTDGDLSDFLEDEESVTAERPVTRPIFEFNSDE